MGNSIINQKSFTLIKRITSAFILRIENISVAYTLLFRIKERIRIRFLMTFLGDLSLTIKTSRIKMAISAVKLTVKPPVPLNLKKISISYRMKQTIKAATSILFHSPIVFLMSLRQKVSSTISTGRVHVTATPSLAKFFTLAVYDPETLATLDSQTLSELDSIAV